MQHFSVSFLPKTVTISHQNFDFWLALKCHTNPPWKFNFSRHKIPQISARKIRLSGKNDLRSSVSFNQSIAMGPTDFFAKIPEIGL
jgi:hypothetical protein